MRYVLDEVSGEVMVEITEGLIWEACSRIGTTFLAPTRDQALLLGIEWPLTCGWVQRAIGNLVPQGHARAALALGAKRDLRSLGKRKDLANARSRAVGQGSVPAPPPAGSPPS